MNIFLNLKQLQKTKPLNKERFKINNEGMELFFKINCCSFMEFSIFLTLFIFSMSKKIF